MPDHYADRDTPYRDKEWLEQKYHVERLSQQKIARLCGVGQQTISRWMDELNVEKRSFGGLPKDLSYKNEEWLREQYWERGKSQQQIADECGVTLDPIQRQMRKFDIETRSSGGYPRDAPFNDESWLREKYCEDELKLEEVAELGGVESEVTIIRKMDEFGIERRESQPGNRVNLTTGLEVFLEGLLLGDGHLSLRKGGLSAQYEHSDKRREYLEWLSAELSERGVEQSGSIRALNNGCFAYKSLAYRDFASLHERWYGSGSRAIPDGFEVGPTHLKHWYIGDGTYSEGQYSPNVTIALDFQAAPDAAVPVDSIRESLAAVGIDTTRRAKVIYIRVDSVERFFSYILSEDPQIPPGYAYKFPEQYVE